MNRSLSLRRVAALRFLQVHLAALAATTGRLAVYCDDTETFALETEQVDYVEWVSGSAFLVCLADDPDKDIGVNAEGYASEIEVLEALARDPAGFCAGMPDQARRKLDRHDRKSVGQVVNHLSA